MAKHHKKKKSTSGTATAKVTLINPHMETGIQTDNDPLRNSNASTVSGRVSSPSKKERKVRSPSLIEREWFCGLALVLFVILTYSPVWWAGFIWDDNAIVTGNPVIVGPLGLRDIWTTSASDICPFTLTTFWFEYALWGDQPAPYHLVNILVHAACALVLWNVLRTLNISGAWMGASAWALHPVQVESVAWISELKNTESCLFFLLSLLFFVKWLGVGKIRQQVGDAFKYFLMLTFAVLAMASKSSTVILPIIFCLCVWWLKASWAWRDMIRLLPVFLMSIVFGLISIWSQGVQMAAAHDRLVSRPWLERLVIASDSLWFYLGKLIWPHPLITVYSTQEVNMKSLFSYLPFLAVAVMLFLLWRRRNSVLRPCLVAFAFFLTGLMPVLGLVDIPIFRYSRVFDHFQYLASMGPLVLAGSSLSLVSNFTLFGGRRLQGVICYGFLLILAMASWQNTWSYKSEETLWTHTLLYNSNCWVAHNNLGNSLVSQGRNGEAINQYEQALKTGFNDAVSNDNLGVALSNEGREDEGIVHYKKALDVDPDFAEAHCNLGGAFFRTGEIGFARAEFERAIEIEPKYAQAHNNLGWLLFKSGEIDSAIDEYKRALESNPIYVEAHINLGVAFIQKGQYNEAANQFAAALRIDPQNRIASEDIMKLRSRLRESQ